MLKDGEFRPFVRARIRPAAAEDVDEIGNVLSALGEVGSRSLRMAGSGAEGGGDAGTKAALSQRMSPALIKALAHPVRREAMRLLNRSGEGISATQMSQTVEEVGSNISYHLKVLADLGAARQVDERYVRGVPEKFFVSELSDHEQIVTILADTEGDDEWLRRSSGR
jgi:DNA-binding transcriptional ArsR family regulator